jgi:membrane associated rhomboid family serine protease
VCRACGALVGAGEAACMMCGEPSKATPTPRAAGGPPADLEHADPETRRFLRAIIMRPAPFTFLFLTTCVFLFLLMKSAGVDENPTGVLTAYGAKLNFLIDRGEWWRFVTPIFLHGGPSIGWIHLLVNMYGLFMLGPYVEKLYGSARFTFFWVFTGVGGTLASYLTVRPDAGDGALERFLFRAADVPSVGASGALFGLVGVLFVFGIKFRQELPEGFKRAFGAGMLPMIAINIFIGYALPIIDNAAHLGGLFSGMLAALFVGYKRPGPRGPVAYAWHAAQALALVLVAGSFALVAYNFAGTGRAETAEGRARSYEQSVAAYLDTLNRSGEVFMRALDGDPAGAQDATAELDGAPSFGEQEAQLRVELTSVLIEAINFGAGDKAARETPEAAARRAALEERMKAWQQRYDEWVAREGASYGITSGPAPTPAEEKK